MGKGQLLFKGDKPKSKSKNKKHKTKKKTKDSNGNDGVLGAATAPASAVLSNSSAAAGASSASASSSAAATQAATPTITKGSGKITTSGSVIMGHGTKFMKEINVGDAILVDIVDGGGDGDGDGDEEKQQQEMRVVTMRLSDTSINLSSGFSSSLSSPTPFHYIRKPRNIRQEQREKQKARDEETKERQMHAFDVYGGSNTLVYREKTETGSYRIKTETLYDQNGASSRQRLLDLRAKKTSDKYC